MADLAVGPTHAHALRGSEHLRVEIDGLGGAVDDEVRADLRVAVGNRLHGRAHARSPSCIRVHAGSREGTYVRSLTTVTSCRKGDWHGRTPHAFPLARCSTSCASCLPIGCCASSVS